MDILNMVQKSQIFLSKMSTAQGMYNYSANSILSSAWCACLFSGALNGAMIRVCVCLCDVSLPEIFF